MSRRALAVLAVVALAVPAWAEGPQRSQVPKTIKVELSGYSLDLNLPVTPPQKVVRGINLMQGHSRPLGPVTGTSVAATFAAAPVWPLPEWCTGDTVVFLPLIKAGYMGLRFEPRGDLLEIKGVPDPDPASAPWGICWDYAAATHPYTLRASGEVIAGTGRFSGVKGTVLNPLRSFCPDPQDCGLTPILQKVTITLEK